MKTIAVAIAVTCFALRPVMAESDPAFDNATSIWYQARKGDLESVRKALEADPKHLNAMDPLKRPPLVYAVKAGRTATAEFLLNQKEVKTDTIDLHGYTAWHWAAMYGHTDVLRLIKKHRLDPDVRDENGNTPLHVAFGNIFSNVHGRHAQVVETLLEIGADPNARNEDDETPLFGVATLSGSMEAATPLLAHKRVDVNAQNKDGDTALHRTVAWGSTKFVSTLLKANADTSIKNSRGETALEQLPRFRELKFPESDKIAREIEESFKEHERKRDKAQRR